MIMSNSLKNKFNRVGADASQLQQFADGVCESLDNGEGEFASIESLVNAIINQKLEDGELVKNVKLGLDDIPAKYMGDSPVEIDSKDLPLFTEIYNKFQTSYPNICVLHNNMIFNFEFCQEDIDPPTINAWFGFAAGENYAEEHVNIYINLGDEYAFVYYKEI